MATKRKPGDGVEESPDKFAKPLDNTTESSSKFAKPVYLVAAREDDQAAYSVLKVDATAVADGDERPRIHTVAGLPRAEPGVSFVAAHSKHGSWIVGVGGGLRAGTIIFDPRTLKIFQGPRLGYPKHKPVLISHGGEAVPLGGSLFVACPTANNSITASASASVFHMSIKIPSSTPVAAVGTPSLSIQEFKVVACGGQDSPATLLPPGKGQLLFHQVKVILSPEEPQSLAAAPG